MRTPTILALSVLVLAACGGTEPNETGTLNDTIVVSPIRFAGVPGFSTGITWEVKDTLGLGMWVDPDSLTWTVADSSVASLGGHDWTVFGIAGDAVGNTVVRVSYNGDTTSIPVEVATATFTSLVAGHRTTCALDTEQRLYCWGFNLDNRNAQPFGQTHEAAVRPPVDQIFASIDVGVSHACGITPGHILKCWGGNGAGERGNGDPGVSSGIWEPVAVSGGLQFQSVAVGGNITCGVTTAGSAYCWGRNYRGELGVGDTLNRSVPTAVSGSTLFTRISTGGPTNDAMATHTCGLDDTSHLRCWGSNEYGQLGDGTNISRKTPTRIDTLRTYTQIEVGGGSTCALGTDQKVYCWGDNQYGQLGRDTTQVDRPVPINSGASYTAVSFGEEHACALTTGGAIHCWGGNAHGELGRGTSGDGNHPDVVAVTGSTTWTAVTAGAWHTCGRASTGIWYCWGGTPTPVVGQTGLSASP